MASKQGPFVFTAAVIGGCLLVGVASVVFAKDVPSLVVSVILACGVATLLYGIIGGVTEAGFEYGPLKVGGSAAVLLGGVWLFNTLLDPQLQKIRDEARLEKLEYFFDHVQPNPSDWFAVRRKDGVPVTVIFTDPVMEKEVVRVEKPDSPQFPLRLSEDKQNKNKYLVLGTNAKDDESFGYMMSNDVISAIGSVGGMIPGKVYPPQSLNLMGNRRWGEPGPCDAFGTSMPFWIEVTSFRDSSAHFNLTTCGTNEGSEPYLSASLGNHEGALFPLTIAGKEKTFLIAVVAANHQEQGKPIWSRFLAMEMKPKPAS